MVWVGPPLLANAPRWSSVGVTWVKPGQVLSVAKLTPATLNAPKQFPPEGLLAMREFLMFSVPSALLMPPPWSPAVLPLKVLLVTVSVVATLPLPPRSKPVERMPPWSPAALPLRGHAVLVFPLAGSSTTWGHPCRGDPGGRPGHKQCLLLRRWHPGPFFLPLHFPIC